MNKATIRLCGDTPPQLERTTGDGRHASVWHSGLTPAQIANIADRADELAIEVYEKTSGDGYDDKLVKRTVFARR